MNNILLVDFGSTFTKATYINIKEETLLTAQSYSTVEEDIRIGYQNVLASLNKKAKKTLTFDKVIACSSAAGGLKMAAIGLVPELTVEAAKRTCMGAGAKVDLVFSYKLIKRDIEKIKENKIDIILLSGGTDGGNKEVVLHNAKLLAESSLDIPIIYAGNRDLQDEIVSLFPNKNDLYICENIMKHINTLSFEDAKEKIREVFLKKIIFAKGIKKIETEIDRVIFPTPEAVLNAATLLSLGTVEEEGLGDLILVDVGGATTDIYSMTYGLPKKVEIVMKGLEEPYSKRTVEGDFGMRYSALGVVSKISEKEIKEYLKSGIDLVKEAKKRVSNPSFIPISEYDKLVDNIIAKYAVSEAVKRHVGKIEPYYTSMGMMYYQIGKNLQDVKLVIGTGGVIINSSDKWSILESVTGEGGIDLRPVNPEFAVDEKYLLSSMGLLATLDKNLALRLMKKYIVKRDINETKKQKVVKYYSSEESAKFKEVLASWKTGNDPLLDLDKAVERLKKVPEHKNFSLKLMKAKKEGRTYIQPRAGVALLEEHISLLKHLEEAGADFLPTTIDSYTRQNRYEEAERGIEESKRLNRSMLNGFPAVNYGVSVCARVLDEVNLPLQARHGTPDSRLLAEIIHAAGWTSNEGGAISYNLPYAKNVSVHDSILYWQYCDRLVGYYGDRGITINREPFGPLTGTLVPPCITNVVGIIEALLAAEQGVKNITVGYGMGGNLIQDIAAMQALEEQTNFYLKKYGYNDVFVTTVFHQWMGGFPADEAEAMGLIAYSSAVAQMAGATKVITKTPLESIGIPTKEANASGIKTSKLVVQLLKNQKFPDSKELEEEKNQIKKEVDSLLYHTYKLGDGDLAIGTVKAFEMGIIDIPFAPSKFNKGAMLPARDNEGNIRILEFGNLGLSDEIKEFHKKKLKERAKIEKREVSFQMTVDDIYAVSNGVLVGRKDGNKK